MLFILQTYCLAPGDGSPVEKREASILQANKLSQSGRIA